MGASGEWREGSGGQRQVTAGTARPHSSGEGDGSQRRVAKAGNECREQGLSYQQWQAGTVQGYDGFAQNCQCHRTLTVT